MKSNGNWAFEPVWIAVAAGMGSTIEELSGYLLGAGGRKVISERHRKKMDVLVKLFSRHGSIVISIFALTPLPDDLILILLSVMRCNILKAFMSALIGKFFMNLVVAYSGRFSMQIIGNLFEVESDWASALIEMNLTIALWTSCFLSCSK